MVTITKLIVVSIMRIITAIIVMITLFVGVFSKLIKHTYFRLYNQIFGKRRLLLKFIFTQRKFKNEDGYCKHLIGTI